MRPGRGRNGCRGRDRDCGAATAGIAVFRCAFPVRSRAPGNRVPAGMGAPETALLAGVQFAQMQDLPLDGAPGVHAQTLAHRVVDMLFAVLAPDSLLEEHAA